jgi:hypothetical protein
MANNLKDFIIKKYRISNIEELLINKLYIKNKGSVNQIQFFALCGYLFFNHKEH